MILLYAALALAAREPNSGVSFKIEKVDSSTAAYVATYAQCFENAAVAAKGATPEIKQHRYEQCRSTRSGLMTRFASEAPGRLQAKRNLERSMNVIEKAFAPALAVTSEK
jgi:hypothetical protein